MRPRRSITSKQKKELGKLLAHTGTQADFQRVQCVWLRATLDLDHRQTAQAVGLSPVTVRIVQSRYLKRGTAALAAKPRGGRRRENLTIAQEDLVLGDVLDKAKAGGVLVVAEIKAAYEKAVGRAVPKSTVYRMLARHGWRKIAPRPHHPQSDPAAREEFKKNSRRS